MKSLVIHAWVVYKDEDGFYLPYTHWVYLRIICKLYDKVCLLSPVVNKKPTSGCKKINELKNVCVFPLPSNVSYASSIKSFFHYVMAYVKLRKYSVSYVRYPTPFGWLQRVFMRGGRYIHYVGDPVDALKNNRNVGFLKKSVYLLMFVPEFLLYVWACKTADKVFTNGDHLAKKLFSYGVKAKPLISSTLTDEDIFLDENKIIDPSAVRVVYIGYLRKAKGVEDVIAAFFILKEKYPTAKLDILGDGEMYAELLRGVTSLEDSGVKFWGHVDDRIKINKILRGSDVFCFASLSEGSPRVVLEAMANGVNVVSTPVGSLPTVFSSGKDILFADFNSPESLSSRMSELIEDGELAKKLRVNANNKVKSMTLKKFIEEIFCDA